MVTLLVVWMLVSVGLTAAWMRVASHVPASEPAPVRIPETAVGRGRMLT